MKLIFIHGSGGVGDVWMHQKQHFSEADAPDLPGHPQGQACGSIEAYADWLHKYIEHRKYEDVVLAGHSLGGGIVLQYALKYQDRLIGIIPIGSGARLRVLPLIIDAIRSKLDDRDGWLNDLVMPLYATVDEKTREMLKPKFRAVGPAAQLNDFLCCDSFDIMERVGLIKIPAMAVVGDQDNMTPPKYSQYLVKNMPACRMTVIEGAGHLAFMEKPAAVNQAIAGFLKEL
jgi:pimeloyl-ACP methyl ester carboxylesterase